MHRVAASKVCVLRVLNRPQGTRNTHCSLLQSRDAGDRIRDATKILN